MKLEAEAGGDRDGFGNDGSAALQEEGHPRSDTGLDLGAGGDAAITEKVLMFAAEAHFGSGEQRQTDNLALRIEPGQGKEIIHRLKTGAITAESDDRALIGETAE